MPPRSTSPIPPPAPLPEEMPPAASFDSDCHNDDCGFDALLPPTDGIGPLHEQQQRRQPTGRSHQRTTAGGAHLGRPRSSCCSGRDGALFLLGGIAALFGAYVFSAALNQDDAHSFLPFNVIRGGPSDMKLDGIEGMEGGEGGNGEVGLQLSQPQPPQWWLNERTQRFNEITETKCRHPYFFDTDDAYYDMTRGAYVLAWEQTNWRYHFKRRKSDSKAKHRSELDKMKKKKKKLMTLQKQSATNGENTTQSRSITFVHVGKAGGSTLLCNIRSAFKWGKSHCPGYVHGNNLPFPYTATTESAISKQTNCYVHYDERTYCYDLDASFLVNVRNPINRLASWFLYEHVRNFEINVDPVLYPSRPKHCGQLMVYNCYDSLDDLVTVGLGRARPVRGTSESMLRVGLDLSEEECSAWAWAAVQGNVPASFHNVWNYDWYLHYLLEEEEYEVFVLRIEHLDQDWSTVDRMVGGDGAPLPETSSHANEASAKPLPVSNKTVSDVGLVNLCRALCDEIQTYKRILARSANLDGDDLRTTLDELRLTCPEEVDIGPRECRY